LFGTRENALTRWVGRHKRLLQWLVVALAVLLLLVGQLTPAALLGYAVGVLVAALLIELVGAPEQP
jgi:hypothetical protein